MRIVLAGMRRSRVARLRTLVGQQASAVLEAHNAPLRLSPPPAALKPYLNARAPALIHAEEPGPDETLKAQLERAEHWLEQARDICLVIGHVSAAEAVAAAIEAEESPHAALEEWREDAACVLDVLSRNMVKTLVVNVAGACAAPDALAFQFELRFARSLFVADPKPVQESGAAALLVPAGRLIAQDDPETARLDTQLENAAAIGARRPDAVAPGRLLAAADVVADRRRRRERDEERLSEGAEQLERKLEMRTQELKRRKRRIEDLEEEMRALRAWQVSQDRRAKEEATRLTMALSRAETSLTEIQSTLWWRLGKIVRYPVALLRRRLGRRARLKAEADAVRTSDLFDSDWYLERYPDVAQSGIDPAVHFVASGWRELRSPGPQFDAAAYLMDNRDVAEAGINPLMHYLSSGLQEQRAIHPVLRTARAEDAKE